MTSKKFGLLNILLAGAMFSPSASANVTLFEKDGWAARFSGFVEFDAIWDTTRTYTEVQGNTAIPDTTTFAGSGTNGRAQFSLRNSRLAFGVEAPEACGFKTKGYIESDFFGFDPNASAADNTKPTLGMSEAAFYTNPTFRIRHAYMQADNGGFSLLVGQYWQLFGMQPNYFMPTDQVAPVAAMLYARTPQVRLTQNFSFGEAHHLQLAIAALRPPQRDSMIPDFQGGARVSCDSWSANWAGGSSSPVKLTPTSLSVSGLVRNFNVVSPNSTSTGALTNNIGWAIAANGFLPVYSNLSLSGEFTYGYGFGDQFNSFSGGLTNPTSVKGATTPTPQVSSQLDAGIGGYDTNGAFQLVKLITWNVSAQWHMPELKTYVGAGAGQLYSPNVLSLTGATYNRSLVIFGNVVHNFTEQIRSGLEYAYTETGYDSLLGKNHRVQMTTSFIW